MLFLFELTAPLAFVLVWFYNGQRGACSPLLKKAFYWFYPVHLLVLAMVSQTLCCKKSPPSGDSGLFTASHIGNIAPVSSSMAGTVTSIHTVEWATA